MFGLTGKALLLFVISVAGQLAGLGLLPKTRGFTEPVTTLASIVMFAIGFGAMARLIHGGINLGSIVPVMATIVPLATVGIGVLVYGESVSLLRIGLLVTACVLVGVASRY